MTDIMVYVKFILKGQIGKGVYLQWESNQNLRIQSSEYNSLCYWNLSIIENTVVQLTYPCLLPLFVTKFESSRPFFFQLPPLVFLLPFCASCVSMDFPGLSFWFSMIVGGMIVRVSFFWCASSFFVGLPLLLPLYAGSHHWQTDNYSPVHFYLRVFPQHHPSSQMDVPEQHRFAPLCSFRKGFLHHDAAVWHFRDILLLLLFCSFGGCCFSSLYSDGKLSWKVCLLWHLPQ